GLNSFFFRDFQQLYQKLGSQKSIPSSGMPVVKWYMVTHAQAVQGIIFAVYQPWIIIRSQLQANGQACCVQYGIFYFFYSKRASCFFKQSLVKSRMVGDHNGVPEILQKILHEILHGNKSLRFYNSMDFDSVNVKLYKL